MSSDADVEEVKAKSAALTNASMKIGQAIYAKSNANSSTTDSADAKKSDEAEAEYEEKDKNDKK